MSYADVNGLSLYYEEIGEGDPLIALHGGIGAGVQLAPLARELATGRRVVLVDLQGHGHTADIDRPLRHELMADDVAALIDHLGAEQADVLGYSLGGEVALRTAIQHSHRIRRLVLISIAFRRDGSHPEVVAAMDGFSAEAAEFLKQGPLYELYTGVAPRPEDWPQLIAKTADLLHQDFDWGEDIDRVTARTMLVYADSDSVRPAHIVEFYGLLGGGLRDAGWDLSAQPEAQLAILPGKTHYDVTDSPLLAPAVAQFLGAT
jgi:pimeloyl-ACP methyl ester carboxylesterase